MSASQDELRLGAGVVQLLLPHRRPFLMVDGVISYRRSPRVELRGYRQISANEPVFDGHFPGVPLWPGVYTIEGLGQCINIALVLEGLQAGFVEHGANEEDVIALLRNEQLGATQHPGYRAELSTVLHEACSTLASRFGVSAALEVKLIEPVFAGHRIDYHVARTHVLGDLERFEVTAAVEGRTVAKGFMSSAQRVGRLAALRAP